MQILIKQVSGKGFLTFKDTFIQDFEKFGNSPVLIVGENKVDIKSISNGSGKSSLIEALNFVFFGTTARPLKYADEVINWNSESCIVISKILLGNEEYEILRERKIGKATTLTIFHSLGSGKSEEILPQADNKTKQAWLEGLLGFSFTSWSCAVMFHQDFVAFPDLKPAQRAEILSEVAGLDIYLEAAKLSSKKITFINNRVMLLEYDVRSRLESLERLKVVDYDDKIEQFESDRQQKIIALRKKQREEKKKDDEEKKKATASLCTKKLEENIYKKEMGKLEIKKTQVIEDSKVKEIAHQILALEMLKAKEYSNPELDSKIQELENELKSLPNVVEQHQEQIRYSTEIVGEIGILNRDIEKLNKEMNQFQTLGVGECPTCKQQVSAEHLQEHIINTESELLVLETKGHEWRNKKELSSKNLNDIKGLYDSLKRMEVTLTNKRKERQQLELIHFKTTEDEIKRLTSEKWKIETGHLDHLNSLIKNFEQQLHNLQLEQQALQLRIDSKAGESSVAALESQIESVRQLENNYIGLKAQNDQQIKEVQDEITTMQFEITTKSEAGNYLSYWIEGYKRLRMMMFDSLIIRLEELSQDFLSEYSSELSISITGEKDLKGGGKKDEIYIEVVNEKGKKSSFEAYSGGERQKVKLAVSLGLADVIKEKCGKDFNLIIFDEMNTALDDVGKEANFKTIKLLSEKGKTVLNVDHDNWFQDQFDNIIKVVKENGGSRIAA